MTLSIERPRHLSDYSLVGEHATLAVEKGLADARWYTPPIPKEKMRELLERRDGPPVRDTLIWFALLLAFGLAGLVLWGSGWALIPFALYGVIYASSSDSRWHETSHGTAFKTDWMNNALYEMASFMVLRESVMWRWSHARHHSDTIIVGRDPEIAAQRPISLPGIVLKFFNIPTIFTYFQHVLLHASGRMTPEERTYVPESEFGKVFMRARIYVLIYLVVFALAMAGRSILPLMFIGLPSLYGAWLMVVYGLTQHAGLAENVLDHRLNSRTVYMNRIHRYLYWNMGYHLEHHIFPMVPYHNLAKLHELMKSYSPPPYNGLVEVYREIIPTLIRQSKDPDYYVRRPLPAPSQPAPAEASPTSQVVTSAAQPDAEGWVQVCDLGLLVPGDVLRFEHEDTAYAIYRTAIGQLFATEGMCTHGNAQLADGFLQGAVIECPKHNGRFDIRDGSVRRPPPCVALKTFDVQEKGGKILLNVASAHGKGVAEAIPVHTLRVVSNENVATFIKELVLELDDDSPPITYRPGEYLQFEIPAYGERSLADVEVTEPYATIWREQKVFNLRAINPTTTRRGYSMASNPGTARRLVFNVRLATPPRGVDASAGVGSSHIFSLRPGDRVAATGPFGSFHIQETDREMIYLGGGSGMAPLRSHLSSLFDTLKTSRRVSFWYGARSLQELYYEEYFRELARKHPNFSFHVALSEPQPDDQWVGHTGFIHEVLKREYLDSHPDPTQVEYYLCGPLPMIRAAMKMLADFGVKPDQIASDEF
jgi:Na+-transporting NADH:ubiquinone oxidoreductase subunit F